MNKKKLAIVTTHPIQYNAPLFRLLADRGAIEIKVFYTWGSQVMEEKFDPGFGRTVEWDIPLLDGYDYSFVKNIAAKPGSSHFNGIDNPGLITDIETWKADAVLVYGWNFKSHLKILRYFKGKLPVFFRGDSTLLNRQALLKSVLRKIFLSWVYRHVDIALYVGTHNKNYYSNIGLKESQLVYAPHAIDLKRFAAGNDGLNQRALEWRRDLGIPGDAIVLLYAGKLEPVKNLGIVMKVAKELEAENIYFILVGNGVDEQSLKNESTSKTIFIDFQNQQSMPLVYRLGDVFLLPSVSETWGLSINEAMASGRPVLASSQCGAAIDLVKEGITGFVFSPFHPGSLMEIIKNHMQDKERLSVMGLNAADLVKEWSFGASAAAIEKAMHNNV